MKQLSGLGLQLPVPINYFSSTNSISFKNNDVKINVQKKIIQCDIMCLIILKVIMKLCEKYF